MKVHISVLVKSLCSKGIALYSAQLSTYIEFKAELARSRRRVDTCVVIEPLKTKFRNFPHVTRRSVQWKKQDCEEIQPQLILPRTTDIA